MKKLLTIILILLVCATFMFAQNDPADPQAGRNVDVYEQGGGSSSGGLFFGAKLGVGWSTLRFSDDLDYYEPEYGTGIFSFQIGARVGYFFGNVGIMLEAEYIKKGFSIDYTTGFYLEKEEYALHYVDFNLMFVGKFGSLYGGLGVYVGTLISAKYIYYYGGVKYDLGYADGFNKADVGLVLTLGYKLSIFTIGLDFKWGFTNVFEKLNYSRYRYTNISLLFNFGILFGN